MQFLVTSKDKKMIDVYTLTDDKNYLNIEEDITKRLEEFNEDLRDLTKWYYGDELTLESYAGHLRGLFQKCSEYFYDIECLIASIKIKELKERIRELENEND